MQDFIRGKACEGPWRASQALAELPSICSASLSAGEEGHLPDGHAAEARSDKATEEPSRQLAVRRGPVPCIPGILSHWPGAAHGRLGLGTQAVAGVSVATGP